MEYPYNKDVSSQNDTSYVLPAQVIKDGEDTYINLNKEDIKSIHDRIFTEQVSDPDFMNILVRLEISYIPVLLFVIIIVTLVNMRWNRAFKRLQKIASQVDKTPEIIEKIGILKSQKINLWDSAFVYFVMLMSSAIIDVLLMVAKVESFPFGLILVTTFIIQRVLTRLVDGSTLKGQNDEDIKQRFEEILDGMILKPIVGSIASKIEKVINGLKKENTDEKE